MGNSTSWPSRSRMVTTALPVCGFTGAARVPGAVPAVERHRQAEVDDLHAVRGQHDVLGGEVAVHDAAPVRDREDVGDGRGGAYRLRPGQRTAAGQPPGQHDAVE